MNVSRIDISEYARNRRRLRLLPNVLDYLLAYSLSRPIMKAGETIALVSRPELVPILGTTPVQAYRTVFDAWGMPGVAIVYGLYMVLYIGLNLWLFGVLKTSVRSDRSREMWLYIGLCIVFALWFGARFGVLAGAILGVPILLFAWLLLRHRRRLSPIGEDPIFRHLVGVSRRSFAYASTRFAFYSAESVKVYWSISRHALRIVLTICLLAVLVFPFSHYRIMRRADLESPLASMMDTFMGGSSAWLLIIVFVILVNWGRNAVARAIYRMLADVRRKVAVTASQIAQRDRRPPILFLRSFRDDEVEIPNERHIGSKWMRLPDERVRLEEVIAETLFEHGPLVALSNPADEVPPLGAARESVADEDWQSTVLDYMEQSSLIVFIVSRTESFQWEVTEAVSRNYLHKSLFVFPPDYRDMIGAVAQLGVEARAELTDNRLLIDNLPALASQLGVTSAAEEIDVLGDALVLCGHGDGLLLVTSPNDLLSLDDDAGQEPTKLEFSESVRLCVALRDRPLPGFETDTAESAAAEPS